MTNKSAMVANAQGAKANTSNGTSTDLFAMFQQFMAQQGAQAQAPAPKAAKARIERVAEKVAKVVVKAEKRGKGKLTGARIHEINGGKSFFVYGPDASALLAPLFLRKPHLDRGLKERDITGVGKVPAYWFGGRQLERVKKALKVN